MTMKREYLSPSSPYPEAHAALFKGYGVTSRLIPVFCLAGLLWPAIWNGYPIVFADTGTYLSQAMHRYLGWDRPAFYSLFIFPLHLRLTTWPVILVQSCLTVLVLDLTRRAFGVSRWWLLAVAVFLAGATWLPWMVSELMPDVFTPLLVLLLGCLVFAPAAFRMWERVGMTALAAFMISAQQSSVPLSLALLGVFIPLRWFSARHRRPMFAPVLAPAFAIAALLAMNAVGHGRLAISPYGNVFLLARVIYDGPGMAVLRRDCPASGWRLCAWLDRFPPTSDEFLWDSTSPILLAGGHKAVSADADAIIHAAARTDPVGLLRAIWVNAAEQLSRFESGDGLEAWDKQVGSLIDAEFPLRESAAYRQARQQHGVLSVPAPLVTAHGAAAVAGIVLAIVLLPLARRRQPVVAGFLAIALLTLPVSAAITGGLSTPHDRYQSRIVWLPACVALLSLPALLGRRRHPVHAPPGQTFHAAAHAT
ncbi:MAG: hypothetical protein EXR07_16645 [Acetobacteraceae bacterium]|nr:hypothetical protein [Acetobacteraceae bacterium]